MGPYRDLKDPARRRLSEQAEGIFVIEGRLALQAAVSSTYPLVSVLVLRRRVSVLDDLRLPAGVPVFAVEDEVMAGTVGFQVHRGLLAVARRLPPPRVEDLISGAHSPIVVVEGMNDQENLGAIFRNAAAFGAGAVLLDPTCTDPLYRRTVRVSLGHVLRVPFSRLEPWPSALELLRKGGLIAVALTPHPQAEAIGAVAADLHGLKVALVVGAEAHGLTQGAMSACPRTARIPMAPGVDSLNVAAATAIALHRFSALDDPRPLPLARYER